MTKLRTLLFALPLVAGAAYFVTGMIMTGGALDRAGLGAFMFGLLYASGGTFNEVMDRDADAGVGHRHLVVRIGRRRALALVVAAQYAGWALLALP